MRMQFEPFPRMKPLQPSSRHIFARPWGTDSLYSVLPALCTWRRIFSLSKGETRVLETAPATPPARKDATKGCETAYRIWIMRVSSSGNCGMVVGFVIVDDASPPSEIVEEARLSTLILNQSWCD